MEYFTTDFLRFFAESVKIWLMGHRLVIRHWIQAFQGFC